MGYAPSELGEFDAVWSNKNIGSAVLPEIGDTKMSKSKKAKTKKRKSRPLVKRAFSRWRADLKKRGLWKKRDKYRGELVALRKKLARMSGKKAA